MWLGGPAARLAGRYSAGPIDRMQAPAAGLEATGVCGSRQRVRRLGGISSFPCPDGWRLPPQAAGASSGPMFDRFRGQHPDSSGRLSGGVQRHPAARWISRGRPSVRGWYLAAGGAIHVARPGSFVLWVGGCTLRPSGWRSGGVVPLARRLGRRSTPCGRRGRGIPLGRRGLILSLGRDGAGCVLWVGGWVGLVGCAGRALTGGR